MGKRYIATTISQYLNEMAYTSYDSDDDILPIEILNQIKNKLGYKRFRRIGSGLYGTAFRISNTKVLKISKDLKEYEYGKQIESVKNEHIADVYKTMHFEYEGERFAIIIKEYCEVDEEYFDNIIDDFFKNTGGEISLSYLSSEFLYGDIDIEKLNYYFNLYKENVGRYSNWMSEWYDMLMELKSKKIYVKDFNGSNVGTKPTTGKLCIIELGLGSWNNIEFHNNDEIELL